MRIPLTIATVIGCTLMSVLVNGQTELNLRSSNSSDTLLTSLTGQASVSDLCEICKSVEDEIKTRRSERKKLYIIDSRPGYMEDEVPFGETDPPKKQEVHFKTGDNVRVYVVNMNPFLYAYTVTKNEKSVTEDALYAFFGQFSPLLEIAPTPADELAGLFKTSEVSYPNCPKDVVKKLDEWNNRIDQVAKYQIKELDSYRKAYEEAKKKYNELLDPLADCKTLARSASEFQPLFRSLPDDLDLGSLINECKTMPNADLLLEIWAEAKQYRRDHPDCHPLINGTDLLTQIITRAKTAATLVSAARTLREALCKNRSSLARMDRMIEKIKQYPALFVKRIDIRDIKEHSLVSIGVTSSARTPDPNELTDDCEDLEENGAQKPVILVPGSARASLTSPTRRITGTLSTVAHVRVMPLAPATLGRRNFMRTPQFTEDQDSKPKADATPKNGTSVGQAGSDATKTTKLEFGDALFSISGGVYYSSLENQQFGPVLGISRDRNGNPAPLDPSKPDALTSVVGVTDTARRRFGPILLLNARLIGNDELGLHASFGITGKKDNAGVDVEYLFGPSVSFLQHKVFVTVGAFLGKQQKLVDDLFLNAAIPSDFTGDIARKELNLKLGLSISYKIK